MKRHELQELGYLVPIETVPLILKNGILSHRLAAKHQHRSIANAEVNELRSKKVVPGGQPLHNYANLYICPRNPMLYVSKGIHEEICVLRVSTDVLDLPGVLVSDTNAARTYARIRPMPEGLEAVDRAMTFATYWNHEDLDEKYRRKGLKCAEVLVPGVVAQKYIVGAYVSCEKGGLALAAVAPDLSATVNANLFFV